MRGKLIVFEGPDGCGKTTQAQLLYQWLCSGWSDRHLPTEILLTREPGGTELCNQIRQIILNPDNESLCALPELLLYAADRAQHVEGFLKPKLSEGAVIVCDRFTASTLAYQGFGRGLNRELIERVNAIATSGLEADLTIFLDVNRDIRVQRIGSQRDRMEQNLNFLDRVADGFTRLADEQYQNMVRIVCGNESVDTVAAMVKTLVSCCLI